MADFASAIARAVVDQNDFVVGIGKPLERGETVFEYLRGVVGAHHHRHAWPRRSDFTCERRVFESGSDGERRRLQMAVAIDQTEPPILDRMAAPPPLVGPCKRDGAASAFLERGADVHCRDVGLAGFTLANRVGARLGQKQRLVAGDVLQSREIRAQLGFKMQVHVERADVEEGDIEKLGRREIDVGEEALGRRGSGVLIELAKKTLDAHTTMPTDHARRNFVAERDQQNRWMVAELAHLFDQFAPDGALQAAIVEERDVLRPGQPHHDPQTMACGLVQEVASGWRVGAHRVDPEARDETKVLSDLRQRWELITLGIGRKGAVGDALD